LNKEQALKCSGLSLQSSASSAADVPSATKKTSSTTVKRQNTKTGTTNAAESAPAATLYLAPSQCAIPLLE